MVVKIPKILIPRVLNSNWPVVACDQFTSEPEYWEKVAEIVGRNPSTYHIIFPEVYLESADKDQRIKKINDNMKFFLENDVFEEFEGFVLVNRIDSKGKSRKGLVVALDLENYSYEKGSETLIRATEGTIVDRLPPRMEVRKNALIESPHIMVLIDDPEKAVIEPLFKIGCDEIYDVDLMLNGGKVTGYKIDQPGLIAHVMNKLEKLAVPKYGKKPLLFAMGDGNHSFATAKAHWESIKNDVAKDHPARYCLVELVNVHDDGLEFEPIHRVVFENGSEVLDDAIKVGGFKIYDSPNHEGHVIKCYEGDKVWYLVKENPSKNLEVGTLQEWLDKMDYKLDYVHGEEAVKKLSSKGVGFILPAMDKHDLFKTVILDGALPRKTFSMGEAEDKRYYLECRRIR